MHLLFAVFSLAAVAAITPRGSYPNVQPSEVQCFRSGQQYHYQLDTQISSGFATVSDQHAITRLQSQVYLQFLSDRKVVMRMGDIEMGTLNRDVSEPGKVQPIQLFKKAPIEEKLDELLRLPVQFDYVEGIIESLRFHHTDIAWSKNIKRSVLNMLQSNIKQREGLAELKPEAKNLDEKEQAKRITDSTMFVLPERTLEGECQTSYTINKVAPSSRSTGDRETDIQMFNVTKSVDFKLCKKIADIHYGPKVKQPCARCDVEQIETKKVDRTTIIRQYFVGTVEKFGIQKVELVSHYMFKIINAEEERPMRTIVTGELNYVEASVDRQSRKSESDDMGQEEQLVFSIEWETNEKRFFMYGDEEFPRSPPFKAVTNKVNQIEVLIVRLVNLWSDKIQGIESEATGQYFKIVELVRMCTVEELKQVKQRVSRESDRLEGAARIKADDILVDAMSDAGTYNTIKYLVELISSREIEGPRAVRAITLLKGLQAPSEKQIDILLRLCRSEVAHRCEALKQTCWLTTGAIIGELCSDEITREDGFERNLPKPICQREHQQAYVKTLMELYKKGETRYEKILALKALGNAGLPESTTEVEKIICNNREDPLVRIQAVDALRRLRAVMPHRIQRILLPIFQNVRERPVIRMTAASMILHTIPDNLIVDQIGYTLLKEPSRQVKSYVYTIMKHLSESPIKIEKQLSTHLKSLLQLAGITEETEKDFIRGSQFIRVPIYSARNHEGLISELESMVGPDNYLPKKLTASIDTLFSGILEKNSVKFGLHQENLENWYQKIYDALVEKLSIDNRKYSEPGVKRKSNDRESSSEEYEGRFESMHSSLKIKKRIRDQYSRFDNENTQGIKPYGMVTARFADVDYLILPFEEEILPEFIKEYIISGKLPTIRDVEDIVRFFKGKHFRSQAAFNVLDRTIKVPTTMGLAVSMIHVLPLLGSIEGTIKAKLSHGEIAVECQIHPVLTLTHLKRVEVWSPIIVTGVETSQTIELNLPINTKLKLETGGNKSVTVTISVPTVSTQIFGLHTLPHTFVAEIEKSTQLTRIPTVKCVENNRLQQQQRSIEEVYGEMFCGVPVKVYGDIYVPHDIISYKKIVNTLLTSENHLHVELDPTNASPREIKLVIDGEAFTEHNDLSSAHRQLRGFYANAKFDDEFERDYQSEKVDEDDDSSLDTFLNNHVPRKMYKHQIRVQLLTVGGHKEKNAKLEAEAVCDEHIKFCQSKLRINRSPLHQESHDWGMKIDMKSAYPEYVNQLEELEKSNKKNRKFVSTVDIEWGSDQKQLINIHINGEQFKPKQWTKKINKVEREVDSFSSLAEQLKLKIAFLNKFDISANYRLQQHGQSILSKYYSGLKALNLWSTQVKPINGIDGSFFATVVIDPITHKHLNVTIKTPTEKVVIDSIRLPYKIKPFELVRESESASVRSNSVIDFFRSYSSKTQPECKADGRKVQTFDGVTYKASLTKCYSVLAKDCSSDSPKFAVLIKKLKNQELKLKVITGKQIIEAQQDETGKLVVKVNGDPVQDLQELLDYGVDYSSHEVNIDTRDVTVRFNGQKTLIKLAKAHKNVQCGLCGHYNDDTEDEFRMANNEHTDDLKGFHKSYTFEDEECKPDLEETYRRENYRRINYDEYTSSEEREEKTDKKPIEKTQVVEYNHKVCFSENPVKECPRRTEPKKTEDKKIKYQCFQRDSSDAREFLRETRRNPKAKLELPEELPSYTETIQVPVSCTSY